MNKRLIIQNLKDCFDLGMTFKQLAICEEKLQNFKISESDCFKVTHKELSWGILKCDILFTFQGSRTEKSGIEYCYFVMSNVAPF